ncbi:MAG: SDR family oxidoreductase [Candidatus Aenigmarchaeota archaeon]|nr:SDR family oxidoreductase [Candidatus Aenigmarchaeota archaeon]
MPDNKIAAITGAYKGLGAALSRGFAERGYSLVLGGREERALEMFEYEMKKATNASAVIMDVRKKADCETLVNTAVEKFGRLDVLVNNAGVWKMAGIEEITEQEITDMFETNLFGPIYCSQAAVTAMKRQGSGHILNIGSTSAVSYNAGHIAYGASKAALVSFTGCMREELKGTGIRVSVFSPGGMKTDLFRAKPDRVKDDFMDTSFVAGKIMEHIETPTEEWHVILRRPGGYSGK